MSEDSISFCQKVVATAVAYRCGHLGEANQLFIDVLDEINNLIVQLDESDKAKALQMLIVELFDAQQRQDSVWMADLMEYLLHGYLDCRGEFV
ncbi:hypothetical protein D5085_06465 [Ectothiorhodospiraceae bacterium BW-2]|nr:hypothetical protein D5085_06465 [Ectothiorhodospiraceae bacterium BW-2]